MNNTETAQQLLFNDDTSLKNSMKLVIEDRDASQSSAGGLTKDLKTHEEYYNEK